MRSVETIFTVGHSTRSAEDFVDVLRTHGIKAVADVRLIPKSRRYPHFNHDEMAKWLPREGVEYLPMKELGGRRRPNKDSINLGWRSESFRGYADYMQGEKFSAALQKLMEEARRRPMAIMCAEAVPWRCHRSLIGDALVVRGWRVVDLLSATKAQEHKVTEFAKVEGERVTYPGEPGLFGAVEKSGTAPRKRGG
jgi:uncharacterized protein (DUF488 family)